MADFTSTKLEVSPFTVTDPVDVVGRAATDPVDPYVSQDEDGGTAGPGGFWTVGVA